MERKEFFYLRKCLVVALHLLATAASYLAAFYLRFDGPPPPQYAQIASATLPYLLVFRGLIFVPLHLYSGLWRHPSIQDLLNILCAVTVSTVAFIGWLWISSGLEGYPRSVFLIDSILLTVTLGSMRVSRKLYRYFLRRNGTKPLLIYGAGDAGDMVVRDIQNNPASSYRPIGFIDDSAFKKNTYIRGIKVLGTRADISRIMEKYKPEELLIAMPSANPRQLRSILNAFQDYKINIRIMPSLSEILEGKVSVDHARNLSMEDLLTRRPVLNGGEDVRRYVEGKTILVTGAGGSIGSELCRQIAAKNPAALFLLDRYENGLHAIAVELSHRFPGLALKKLVGDVTDSMRMDYIFYQHKPQVVFHAAAHKHVSLAEDNPLEALKTNVMGTKNVAEKAAANGSERFVLISTDKAVHPAGIMGMSKRLAELYIACSGIKSKLHCVTVRFGNVMGSNGSVIPIFTEQIKRGGPVTVTHPDVKRYFMLIPEAVHLVLQAAAIGRNGDLFILDMGDQIKVIEIAKNLIRFMGLTPEEDIKIIFTGLGQGEKMFEELYDPDCETPGASAVEGVIKVARETMKSEAFSVGLKEFEAFVRNGNESEAVASMVKLISTNGVQPRKPATDDPAELTAKV